MHEPEQDYNVGYRPAGGNKKILLVDDDEIIRAMLTEVLGEEGYELTTAPDGREAIHLLQRDKFDLIITDMVMPGVNGVEVLLAVKRIDPSYSVIVITGYPSVNTAVRLVNLGATDYITKPFNIDLIRVTVAKVLEIQKARRSDQEVNSAMPMAPYSGITEPYHPDLFGQLLEKEIGRSGLRGYVCSLLTLEIDHLASLVLDGQSSAEGQFLELLARVLIQLTRAGDIIGRTELSEFSLMLPETGGQDAEAFGQEIRRKVAWSFTISAGVASFPMEALDATSLIRAARAAMKAAQVRGGDTVLLRS